MKCNARSLLTLAALGIVALGAIHAAQQQDALKPSDDDNIIRTDVTRVNMLFTVTDKRGRFVTDLTRGDFTIFENKKQQNIREFTAETDLPLRLAILIDTAIAFGTASIFSRRQPAISSIKSCASKIRPWWSASTPPPN